MSENSIVKKNRFPLKTSHKLDLVKSCLSLVDIEKAGYRSTKLELNRKDHSCWEIQYRDPLAGAYWHSRYRLDEPVEIKSKIRKYHQKFGTKVKPYFSQLKTDDQWKAELNDISIPAAIVEGEKKNDCVLANHPEPICSIGISGVWNWSQGNKVLHDHIDKYLAKPNRKITVIVDSDYHLDESIQKAMDTLCQKLIEKACKVFLLIVPSHENDDSNKQGVDDWLYKFPKDERSNKLIELLGTATEVKAIPKMDVKEKKSKKTSRTKSKSYDTYNKEDDQQKLADITFKFTSENEVKTYYKNNKEQIAIFTGKVWEDFSTLKIKHRLKQDFGLDGIPTMVTSAIQDIKSETYDENLNWRQIDQEMVPLKDYIWDCLEDKEIEYSSSMMLKNHIQISNYDQNIETPVWDRVLFDMFNIQGSRDILRESLLHEIFGYFLTQRATLKKAFFFIGAKNTGKSLLGKVITEIIGEDFISDTKLANLSKDFGLSSLPDKMLNIDDEPIADGKDSLCPAIFKTLINPEARVEVNIKGKAQFSSKLFCKFLVLANKLPTIHDDAALDRLIFLKFDNLISEEKRDRKLIDKLRLEYPGIIAKFIKAYSDLAKRDYIFTTPQSSLEASRRFRIESAPVQFWLGEVAERTNNNDDHVTNTEWYECYQRSIEIYDLPLMNKEKLSRELNLLGIEIKSRYCKRSQTNVRFSIGYRLKT